MQYLVHIGYPKSASTWLQRHVFAGQVTGLLPLANGDGSHKPGYDVFETDDAKEAIERRTPSDGAVTVLSSESWAGLHDGSGFAYAQRIHAALPRARVLIVIRSQPEMLVSTYFHWLVKYQDKRGARTFIRDFAPRVDYASIVRLYDNLFGGENVTVLPFEAIRTTPRAFVKPLFDALGLPIPELRSGAENVRDVGPASALAAAPWLNHAGYRISKAASEAIGTIAGHEWASTYRKRLTAQVTAEVADAFRAGNRWLVDRLNTDLGAYGFPV